MTEIGRQTRLTEPEAIANVSTVLELGAAGALKCGPTTGRPTAATVQTVVAHLRTGDFYPDDAIASFAWPLLLQAAGFAKLVGGRLELTPKGAAALRQAPAEVIRELWQRWVDNAILDEFSRIENIKGQRSRNVLTAAKPRRQLLNKALSTAVPTDWIDVDTLFGAIRRRGLSPWLVRSDRALWRLYLADPQYGSLGYSGYSSWETLEGRYTLAVLFEYAGTLGLIDLDYVPAAGARADFHGNPGADELDSLSRYDGLRAIRLNTLGQYVLGMTDTYQPAPAETPAAGVKVLPNLDIVVTGEIAPPVRLLLSAFADHTADRVWTLSASSLLSALDAGRQPSELVQFLSAHKTTELPGTFRVLIDDVTRRAGQLADLGVVRVIECDSAATAVLIAGDRRLRSLCEPVGDRHLAVHVEHDTKFRRALLKLGYVLPAARSEPS